MPYRLMWKKKQGDPDANKPQTILIPLSLEASKVFQAIISGGTYGFKQIDLFTSRFANLSDLIDHLHQCEILPEFYFSDELVIVWTGDKSGFKEKHHSLFFMDKLEYIINPLGKLEEYMNDRAIQEDYNFFTDLIKRVYELSLTASQKYAIEQFQSALETAYVELGPKFVVLDYGSTSSAIKTFLTTLVTKTLQNNYISNTQSQELNWWMVHHLIDFVTTYSEKFGCRKDTSFSRVHIKPSGDQ